jgi:hypothetical protein
MAASPSAAFVNAPGRVGSVLARPAAVCKAPQVFAYYASKETYYVPKRPYYASVCCCLLPRCTAPKALAFFFSRRGVNGAQGIYLYIYI